jgi:hypothetical protein
MIRRGKMMNTSLRTTFFITGIVVLLFSMGCAGALTKNNGRITPNVDADKAFESYSINPGYNYYFSGSDVYPNALIGLSKTYTLEPDLWKKIEPTPQEFRDIIKRMQTRAMNHGMNQHGFAILDDKGKQIGIWYSILSARTFVRMNDDRTVVIYTPDQDTYEKRDGEARDSGK